MLNYLSPHTKVRRLGYLKLIVNQYDNRDYHSINGFPIFLERIAGEKSVLQQLRDYKNFHLKDDKGLVENRGDGRSMGPYIKLCESLSIITRSNYSFILTKYSRVYRVLMDRKAQGVLKLATGMESQRRGFFAGESIFALDNLDKFFFLRQILIKDFLYIKSLLVVIQRYQPIYDPRSEVQYLKIKEELHSEILDQLEHNTKKSHYSSSENEMVKSLRNKFSKSLKIRSYESIVEPRLSWLLDLDIIDQVGFQKDSIKLTAFGELILNSIKDVYDEVEFVESRFISMSGFLLKENQSSKFNMNKLKKFIDESFLYLKTLAPNRIPVSQAINYASFMYFFSEGVIVEYNKVKEILFALDGKDYLIDWFPSENDGSIKKL